MSASRDQQGISSQSNNEAASETGELSKKGEKEKTQGGCDSLM